MAFGCWPVVSGEIRRTNSYSENKSISHRIGAFKLCRAVRRACGWRRFVAPTRWRGHAALEHNQYPLIEVNSKNFTGQPNHYSNWYVCEFHAWLPLLEIETPIDCGKLDVEFDFTGQPKHLITWGGTSLNESEKDGYFTFNRILFFAIWFFTGQQWLLAINPTLSYWIQKPGGLILL